MREERYALFENRDYTVYDDEGNAYVFKFDKYYRALLYVWWGWFAAFWIGLIIFNKYVVWYMNRLSYALVSTNSLNPLYIISMFSPLIYLIIITYFREKYYKTNLKELVRDQEIYEKILSKTSFGWTKEDDPKLAHIPNAIVRYKSAKYIAYRYSNDFGKLGCAYFIFWAFVFKFARYVIVTQVYFT